MDRDGDHWYSYKGHMELSDALIREARVDTKVSFTHLMWFGFASSFVGVFLRIICLALDELRRKKGEGTGGGK